MLLDTNVLLCAAERGSQYRDWAKETIARAVSTEGAAINAVCLAEICVGEAEPATAAGRIRGWGVEVFDVPAAAADISRSPIADIVAEGSASPAGTRRVRHCRTSSSAPTPSSWAGRWLPQMQADSRPISRRCSCASPEFPAGDRQRVAIRSGRMHSQALRIRSQQASSCPNGSRPSRHGRDQTLDHGRFRRDAGIRATTSFR